MARKRKQDWLSLSISPTTPPSSAPSSHSLHHPQQDPSNHLPPSARQQHPSNYVAPFPEADGQTPSTTFTFTAALLQRQDPPPPPPTRVLRLQDRSATNVVNQHAHPPRRRTTRTQAPRGGKDIHVPPPFPWATNLRATVRSLNELRSLGINTIQGEVQCKRCERRYEIEFDLMTQFEEISEYIRKNKRKMNDRAPLEWKDPKLPDCRLCEQTDCLKPVISPKKRSINWLFLLLGKMLGICTLEQLKYFCKHNKNHRTGAKDRVLYLTYLGLCKQLYPDVVFEWC
ncbi:uncharacterized protein LOC131229798 [Magnolia sinica]|uniref:uncharacterized protein LOC131229798 n=1 Tax=Magnolia sinica TaxID=86752 RepID=UPI002658E897|nr:uncharacterized protein LOC131229798 [Magnolia sinica]